MGGLIVITSLYSNERWKTNLRFLQLKNLLSFRRIVKNIAISGTQNVCNALCAICWNEAIKGFHPEDEKYSIGRHSVTKSRRTIGWNIFRTSGRVRKAKNTDKVFYFYNVEWAAESYEAAFEIRTETSSNNNFNGFTSKSYIGTIGLW